MTAPFWDQPDWRGGCNLRDAGASAFWLLPPKPPAPQEHPPCGSCGAPNPRSVPLCFRCDRKRLVLKYGMAEGLRRFGVSEKRSRSRLP
jgi:hypothetical protein